MCVLFRCRFSINILIWSNQKLACGVVDVSFCFACYLLSKRYTLRLINYLQLHFNLAVSSFTEWVLNQWEKHNRKTAGVGISTLWYDMYMWWACLCLVIDKSLTYILSIGWLIFIGYSPTLLCRITHHVWSICFYHIVPISTYFKLFTSCLGAYSSYFSILSHLFDIIVFYPVLSCFIGKISHFFLPCSTENE